MIPPSVDAWTPGCSEPSNKYWLRIGTPSLTSFSTLSPGLRAAWWLAKLNWLQGGICSSSESTAPSVPWPGLAIHTVGVALG